MSNAIYFNILAQLLNIMLTILQKNILTFTNVSIIINHDINAIKL
ncbi:hypothetical protein M2416_003355 [Raoultella sp. BIGb0132]|nr:hypothetical protein [Raoultella sp. BIGb0132]MCS4289759.1 hypothetical protein [Raoultella terrigena]